MDSIFEEQRLLIRQLKSRIDSMELAIAYANDIVAAWPSLTFRELGEMTNRIDTLRQALEAANNG